jgi:proton glutamate symport protein
MPMNATNEPRIKLHWQILIAIVLATLAGLAGGKSAAIGGVLLTDIYEFFGTLFLNALKMLVVPLVTAALICGISNIGAGGTLGRMGARAFAFYFMSTLFAVLAGLFVVNLFEPGMVDGVPAGERMALPASEDVASQLDQVADRDMSDIAQVFIRMVPPNVFAAAAKGEMLSLIFFGLLFGFFMTRIEPQHRETLLNFWQGVLDVMMKMTMFIMRFSPIGVFALVAQTVAATGLAAFTQLAWFFFTVVAGLGIHFGVTLPLAVRLLGGASPLKHYRAMSPALLMAFSTASSAATLPLTIECLERNARVSERTTGFVLPLGTAVNLDGTALYECVAAMFIAQAYGLQLDFATQFTIVTLALLTSIGVAGIPSASLVAITVILGAVGLPLEGIGLLLVTDRVLDMMRTTVNVFSDSCCAVIVARREGETDVLT